MTTAELPFKQPLVMIFFAHQGDVLSSAIESITHGPACHAGWLRSDQKTVAELYYPKGRNRPLVNAEKPGIELFTLEGMTPDLAAKFERFFDLLNVTGLDQDYSVTGLFRFLFNSTPPDEQSVFCSEYVMQGIRKNAPELLPLARCEDYQVSPVDLYRSPRLHAIDW